MFPKASRRVLGPKKSPVRRGNSLFRKKDGGGVKLINHSYPMPRLRMNGLMPVFPHTPHDITLSSLRYASFNTCPYITLSSVLPTNSLLLSHRFQNASKLPADYRTRYTGWKEQNFSVLRKCQVVELICV